MTRIFDASYRHMPRPLSRITVAAKAGLSELGRVPVTVMRNRPDAPV